MTFVRRCMEMEAMNKRRIEPNYDADFQYEELE